MVLNQVNARNVLLPFFFVVLPEEIDVKILRRQKRLAFSFPSLDPTEPREFRVKRMGEELKAGVT